MSKSCEIHHLYHSGCSIEIDNSLLVFDYYLDSANERSIEQGVISAAKLKSKDQVYVFVSHSHQDHFNPVIFDWERYNSNTKYILSSDVPAKEKNNYYSLNKYEELRLDNLYLKSYGTTDQGVSFLVEIADFTIYHSGDLNWWHWKKFSPAERKQEEKEFKEELAKLAGKEIDIAFVPVDPRLEEHFYLAGEYFAQKIQPQLIVPIHFRDNYHITTEFADKIKHLSSATAQITKKGEKILFDKHSKDLED